MATPSVRISERVSLKRVIASSPSPTPGQRTKRTLMPSIVCSVSVRTVGRRWREGKSAPACPISLHVTADDHVVRQEVGHHHGPHLRCRSAAGRRSPGDTPGVPAAGRQQAPASAPRSPARPTRQRARENPRRGARDWTISHPTPVSSPLVHHRYRRKEVQNLLAGKLPAQCRGRLSRCAIPHHRCLPAVDHSRISLTSRDGRFPHGRSHSAHPSPRR